MTVLAVVLVGVFVHAVAGVGTGVGVLAEWLDERRTDRLAR